jgi:hypothetical protein
MVLFEANPGSVYGIVGIPSDSLMVGGLLDAKGSIGIHRSCKISQQLTHHITSKKEVT